MVLPKGVQLRKICKAVAALHNDCRLKCLACMLALLAQSHSARVWQLLKADKNMLAKQGWPGSINLLEEPPWGPERKRECLDRH